MRVCVRVVTSLLCICVLCVLDLVYFVVVVLFEKYTFSFPHSFQSGVFGDLGDILRGTFNPPDIIPINCFVC